MSDPKVHMKMKWDQSRQSEKEEEIEEKEKKEEEAANWRSHPSQIHN